MEEELEEERNFRRYGAHLTDEQLSRLHEDDNIHPQPIDYAPDDLTEQTFHMEKLIKDSHTFVVIFKQHGIETERDYIPARYMWEGVMYVKKEEESVFHNGKEYNPFRHIFPAQTEYDPETYYGEAPLYIFPPPSPIPKPDDPEYHATMHDRAIREALVTIGAVGDQARNLAIIWTGLNATDDQLRTGKALGGPGFDDTKVLGLIVDYTRDPKVFQSEGLITGTDNPQTITDEEKRAILRSKLAAYINTMVVMGTDQINHQPDYVSIVSKEEFDKWYETLDHGKLTASGLENIRLDNYEMRVVMARIAAIKILQHAFLQDEFPENLPEGQFSRHVSGEGHIMSLDILKTTLMMVFYSLLDENLIGLYTLIVDLGYYLPHGPIETPEQKIERETKEHWMSTTPPAEISVFLTRDERRIYSSIIKDPEHHRDEIKQLKEMAYRRMKERREHKHKLTPKEEEEEEKRRKFMKLEGKINSELVSLDNYYKGKKIQMWILKKGDIPLGCYLYQNGRSVCTDMLPAKDVLQKIREKQSIDTLCQKCAKLKIK